MVQDKSQQSQNENSGQKRVVRGVVIKGAQQGRTISVPTANLDYRIVEQQLPGFLLGVYTSRVVVDGQEHAGAFYYGPIWRDNQESMTAEVHVLDFSGDLYGQEIEIHLGKYIRSPVRFTSLAELERYLKHDIELVRENYVTPLKQPYIS